MAVFQYGALLRKYREELGITQEELSEGVCSVPTLSRIENGERMPSRNNLAKLMEKLDRRDLFSESFVDENNFELMDLKEEIRRAILLRDEGSVRKLYMQYKHCRKGGSVGNRQFELLHEVISNSKRYSEEEKLKRLEHILHITCPSYTCEEIPSVLTYEEIIILNSIARSYSKLGQPDKSIYIFQQILAFYERHKVNSEEILRTKPMVLVNLAKEHLNRKAYEESVRCCEESVVISQENGRCESLPITLLIRAQALLGADADKNREEAERTLRAAYNSAVILDSPEIMKLVSSEYKAWFHAAIAMVNQI